MKIALITGASSGMGREMAYQIGDRFSGIDEIWVLARREDRLAELCGQIPARVRCFPADITKEEERDRLSHALYEEKPEVRLLVNAAGYGMIGKVGTLALEEECGMIRLNCEALCAVTHMALPFMAKNSRILQFASSAAFLPQPGFAIYAATKAFVLSYSRALGAELKDREIYVTAVCPGPVQTEFFQIAEKSGQIPFYKRLVMADPKKVVNAALRDAMAGKAVSVYGPVMKLFWAAAKLLPHGLILKIMETM